ncbi:Capsular exopolysaccharide family [Candidatus Accumulibacter aalborgensis]|uniref:Putative tyrosine-protein kinase EpsB n=1 Tax=Candidatus Accumulibacter aalborgensis TaxID=1860102 RepID=A0A1A8XU82_9PROT|nr:polysaccharide biosynthesis tyrosine autokinase [Candidatus Accumulibacter aalborgensis]SBT08624.1 Capsular exopolysaccharide family [Candidatus Accumulibacter aalborgensis]
MEQEQHHPAAASGIPSQIALEDDDEGISLGEIIGITLEYRWLIAALTLVALIIGLFVVVVSRPIYRADGLIQVEEKTSGMGSLKALQPLLGDDTTVSAELEILASRMVLGRVVDRLKLDIVAAPRTMPVIGNAVARRYVGSEPNDAVLGFSSYAWGGETIQVDSLDVPKPYLDEPLLLIAGEAGAFTVVNDDDEVVLQGTTGVRASDKGFSIFIAQLKARPGTRFRLMKQSSESAIDDLRKQYSVKERGKKSGILELALLGRDANQIAAVLDEILNTYVRQNVERRSAEAEKTLKFLDSQLPALKVQVDAAEAAYNDYRRTRGSLDLTLETQGLLKSVVDIEDGALKLKQEREELRQRFTPEHPTLQAVDAKLARLNERRKQFEGEVSRLPDTQQTVLRLARDVEVSTKLYTELLNTAQQLKVSKAGTVGDVRIIDSAAVSSTPVGAKPIAILAIAALLGLLASLVAIWFLRALRVVVEDPETIEARLGLPVYASIPHSTAELALSRKLKTGQGAGELLAISQPEDDAVESLRSLRTTLHFAMLDSRQNSLLITGSSPGLGKSFISKNLGAVLAQAGKRIVIVDADLRRGHINKEFGVGRVTGISEYIAGQATLTDIVKPTQIPNLSIVTTGQIPPNPSELLMHQRFETLLAELGQLFDTIIVDAPPVLAVSDAAIIGRLVGATLIVARAGKHPIQELEQAVKRLNQAGVQVKGFVFNDLNTERQRYRYGYKGYVYRYSYKN